MPDSRNYQASERAYQGAFALHPPGMVLQPPVGVEALDRGPTGPLFALLLAQRAGDNMSRTALAVGLDPVDRAA